MDHNSIEITQICKKQKKTKKNPGKDIMLRLAYVPILSQATPQQSLQIY